MTNLETPGFALGQIQLTHYGEDEVLSQPRQHASSLIAPGRYIEGKWCTLHEIGNRKLISEDKFDAHSFVRNFYNHMVMQAMDSDILGASTYAAGSLGLKQTSGTIGALADPSDIGNAGSLDNGYRAGAGVDDHGILAGRGTNAFSFCDFELQTVVVEGTGTDQMNYVAMADYTAANVVYTGGCTRTWTTTYERFLNNNSGNSITIEEVGLVDELAATSTWLLMARDVLGCSALAIADAGQLKVTYTITSPQFPS